MIDENEYSHKIIKGTSLAWTEEEIVRHYRSAKDPKAMIGILADLNNVSELKIKQVLRKHGISVKQKTAEEKKPHKRKKETKKRAPKVYIKLVSDGVSYSIYDVERRIKRSTTYIKTRIADNDTVVLGGIEYQVLRFERRCKKEYYNDMDGGI